MLISNLTEAANLFTILPVTETYTDFTPVVKLNQNVYV